MRCISNGSQSPNTGLGEFNAGIKKSTDISSFQISDILEANEDQVVDGNTVSKENQTLSIPKRVF